MKSYYQVRIQVKGFNPDLLAGLLFQLGALGVEEYSDDIWFVYFSQDFSPENLAGLTEQLNQLNPAFRPDQIMLKILEDRDWNTEWKKYFQPVKVGHRLWIAPPWESPQIGAGEILVIIDPQMAFGTGTHETTQLMIEAMEKYLKEGDDVLDAGTGSGILSILAKKLGAKTVHGFDIDPVAIENAVHNTQLNKTQGIQFWVCDRSNIRGEEYDLILANITKSVLLDLIPSLSGNLRENGIMILSGIQEDDREVIHTAFPQSFDLLEINQKNEWLAMVYRKFAEYI